LARNRVERSVGQAQAVPPGVARHEKLAVLPGTWFASRRAGTRRAPAATITEPFHPCSSGGLVPALPPSILEPLWVQFAALLRTRQVHHPLGCHRPRVPDRVVFDKLIQILVFAPATAASPIRPARRPPSAAAAMSGSPSALPNGSAIIPPRLLAKPRSCHPKRRASLLSFRSQGDRTSGP
jgi:hypothetical protein